MNILEHVLLLIGAVVAGSAIVCALLATAWCGWKLEQCSTRLQFLAALCGTLIVCGLFFHFS